LTFAEAVSLAAIQDRMRYFCADRLEKPGLRWIISIQQAAVSRHLLGQSAGAYFVSFFPVKVKNFVPSTLLQLAKTA